MQIKRIVLFSVAAWVVACSLPCSPETRTVSAGALPSRVIQELAPAPLPPHPPQPPQPPTPPLPEDFPEFIAQLGGSGYLGVTVEEVTADKVKELGLREERGVLIREVGENTAAAKAGLKPKDVILSLNGTRVEGLAQFTRLLRETPPGRTVVLGIIRDRRDQEVRATLEPRSKNILVHPEIHVEVPDIKIDGSKWPGVIWPLASRGRLGIQIQVLTEQLAEYFGVPDKHGILVTSVNTDSPAAKAGIKAGDVIVGIEDRQVRDSDDISKALRDKEGDVTIRIIRDRQQQTVRATLQSREAPRRTERKVVTRPRVNVVRRPPMV